MPERADRGCLHTGTASQRPGAGPVWKGGRAFVAAKCIKDCWAVSQKCKSG